MRLELGLVDIRDMKFGDKTAVRRHVLHINRDELRGLLQQDSRLGQVDIELCHPGESCRIIRVFDIIEPRAKVEGPGGNFPGVLDPIEIAGQGHSRVLSGVAVVTTDQRLAVAFTAALDMSGPGAALTPYAQTHNVVLVAHPRDGVETEDYYAALVLAQARAAVYLAGAAKARKPDRTEVYELAPLSEVSRGLEHLPRVAYIYPIRSFQRPTAANEPIFYGDNVKGFMPTLVHPNEVLDGAIVNGFWWICGETYAIQNHPVVKELCRRHGKDLCFVGVVLTVAHDTIGARQRSIASAAKLARSVLGADGVIISKTGGGIPETDLMLTCQKCEELGVKTAVMVWEHIGPQGSSDEALTIFARRADAMVSVGDIEQRIDLPPVERVIGGEVIAERRERPSEVVPAKGKLNLAAMAVTGAISQLGFSRLTASPY